MFLLSLCKLHDVLWEQDLELKQHKSVESSFSPGGPSVKMSVGWLQAWWKHPGGWRSAEHKTWLEHTDLLQLMSLRPS